MNNDLISREALKEEINKKRIVGRFNTIQIIDNAPTVEAYTPEQVKELVDLNKKLSEERPQGEWITRHKLNSFGQDVVCFECNKCGEYKVPLYHLFITEPLSLCPNCGADMRKGGAE